MYLPFSGLIPLPCEFHGQFFHHFKNLLPVLFNYDKIDHRVGPGCTRLVYIRKLLVTWRETGRPKHRFHDFRNRIRNPAYEIWTGSCNYKSYRSEKFLFPCCKCTHCYLVIVFYNLIFTRNRRYSRVDTIVELSVPEYSFFTVEQYRWCVSRQFGLWSSRVPRW